MVKKLFFIATLLYIGATASAESYQVKSPDGRIVAELNTDKALSLSFKYNGSKLLQESSIGVVLSDGMDLGKNEGCEPQNLQPQGNHPGTVLSPAKHRNQLSGAESETEEWFRHYSPSL